MNARRNFTVRRWRNGLAALVAALAMVLPAAPLVRAQTLTEGQLRARFLLNFLRFTEWPSATTAASGSLLQLCVLGIGDPFDGALNDLQGATAAGHKISVRNHTGAERANECNLLYVPDNELRRMASAREAIGTRPVLIVGESEAILDRGGMIALRSVDQRLAFVVNLAPARRASLSFSPQMLHAAAEVLP